MPSDTNTVQHPRLHNLQPRKALPFAEASRPAVAAEVALDELSGIRCLLEGFGSVGGGKEGEGGFGNEKIGAVGAAAYFAAVGAVA